MAGAGVVEQHVEASALLPDARKQRAHRLFVADVRGHRQRLATRACDGSRRCSERFDAAPRQHDGESRCRKTHAYRGADTAAGSGDERYA